MRGRSAPGPPSTTNLPDPAFPEPGRPRGDGLVAEPFTGPGVDAVAVRGGVGPTGTTLLQVVGQLAAHTVTPFAEAVEEFAHRTGSPVVVDLAGVTFMDAAGVAALCQFHERVRGTGGDVALVGLSDEVSRILHLCGLDDGPMRLSRTG